MAAIGRGQYPLSITSSRGRLCSDSHVVGSSSDNLTVRNYTGVPQGFHNMPTQGAHYLAERPAALKIIKQASQKPHCGHSDTACHLLGRPHFSCIRYSAALSVSGCQSAWFRVYSHISVSAHMPFAVLMQKTKSAAGGFLHPGPFGTERSHRSACVAWREGRN